MDEGRNEKPVSVRLSESDRAYLEAEADRMGVTVSDVVRGMIAGRRLKATRRQKQEA